MADAFICPFISSGNGGIVLCREGKLEMPSTTKDILRQQAKGQIIDFDALIPREKCRAWMPEDDHGPAYCGRLCSF